MGRLARAVRSVIRRDEEREIIASGGEFVHTTLYGVNAVTAVENTDPERA